MALARLTFSKMSLAYIPLDEESAKVLQRGMAAGA